MSITIIMENSPVYKPTVLLYNFDRKQCFKKVFGHFSYGKHLVISRYNTLPYMYVG